jgi:hypothetical protein
MSKRHEQMLRRVRLELARDPEFPNGSSAHGYDFIAPLDRKGHINLAAWKDLKDRSRVRRFWAHETEEMGHVVHKRGDVWAFHYDIHGDPSHDEAGYRFNSHAFVPGEYVSITEQDGVSRTFRVVSVIELA